MEKINNIDDVKRFFHFLYEECKVAFHPDDEFSCYVNNVDGRQTFTPEECEKYDELMAQSISVCEAENVSVYDTATEIFRHLYMSDL